MRLPISHIEPTGDTWPAVARRQEYKQVSASSGGLTLSAILIPGWQVPTNERWLIERMVVACDFAGATACDLYAGDVPTPTATAARGIALMEHFPLVAIGSVPELKVGVAQEWPPLVAQPGTALNFLTSFGGGTGAGVTVVATVRMDWVVYREPST